MSFTAEQRQAQFEKDQIIRDAGLAYRSALETQSLVRELRVLNRSILEIREQDQSEPDVTGGCVVAALTLLLGSENVSMADSEILGDLDTHSDSLVEKLEPFIIKEGWHYIMPSTSHEFISLMNEGARGALLYFPNNHVVGVIPTWRAAASEEQKQSIIRAYIVINTEQPETVQLINDEELIDLYTNTPIVEHPEAQDSDLMGLRTVLVFTQETPAIE